MTIQHWCVRIMVKSWFIRTRICYLPRALVCHIVSERLKFAWNPRCLMRWACSVGSSTSSSFSSSQGSPSTTRGMKVVSRWGYLNKVKPRQIFLILRRRQVSLMDQSLVVCLATSGIKLPTFIFITICYYYYDLL